MAEKEFRRLKRRELLRMLVMQCEEAERLQRELEETNAKLETLEESYERLKRKLNIKDERLNRKDAEIAELKREADEMRASREIDLKSAGSIAEASLRLSGIFEAAQEAADQYLENIIRLAGEKRKKSGRTGEKEAPAASGSLAAGENPNPVMPTAVVPMYAGVRKKTPVCRPVQDSCEELLHG